MEKFKKITLLHSNDMHGDFLEENVDNNLVGGVSMLSGYIKKCREEDPNTIYCIAGDMFRGSVIDSEYQGLSTIEIMNMLAPDVVTIGNHETDYGLAHLLFIEKCANFPIINANLHITMNNSRLFKPYHILEIDGMKILFIGIITQDVIANTKTGGSIISSFIDIEDATKEIGKICNTFNSIDIDFTVLLTHIGFEEDKKLAAMLDPTWGVDLIVGGHSHTFMDQPTVVNGIPIVQAGTGTDQIGRFDIIVDTDNNCIDSCVWKSIPINADNCPKDEKIEELIKDIKSKTDLKYERVICRLTKDLTHPTRFAQTSLGTFIADILKHSLGLDVFLCGSGHVRADHLNSLVTYRDICEAVPYSDACWQILVNGDQFKRMIKYICRDSTWESDHNEFFQLSSGLHFVYSKSLHDFTECKYHEKDIEDDDIFTVGLTDYVFINFEKCFGFDRKEIDELHRPRKICTSDQDVIVEYLQEKHDLYEDAMQRLIVID